MLLLAAWLPCGAFAADTDSATASPQAKCVARTITTRTRPYFPYEMRYFFAQAGATVRFDVDSQGQVQNVHMLQSAHGAVERASVAAVLKWRFAPIDALATGYCKTYVQHIVFDTNRTEPTSPDLSNQDDHYAPFQLSSADLAKLPADFRYDTAPELRVAAPIVYPYEQMSKGVSGSATVAFYIGPSGRVEKTQLISATLPVFGEALQASMAAWTFKPAQKNGAPSWAVFEYTHEFSQEETSYLFDFEYPKLLAAYSGDASLPGLEQLDHEPKVLYRPLPMIEPTYTHGAETLRLEFVIDREGMVRYVHPIEYKDERLAWAAATAVSRWQFEVPMRNGQAADVRAVLPVAFTASGG